MSHGLTPLQTDRGECPARQAGRDDVLRQSDTLHHTIDDRDVILDGGSMGVAEGEYALGLVFTEAQGRKAFCWEVGHVSSADVKVS